ncbi:MAG: sigma-70 family RNA polymerase sigma factor [Carbonactinosporaceae bacterium]
MAEPGLSATARFEWIFTTYHPRVRGYVYSLVDDWHLAEDLTAETFLYAWRHIEKTEAVTHLFAWLVQAARWQVSRHYARHRVQREHVSDTTLAEPPNTSAAGMADQVADRVEVAQLMAMLPPRQRQALLLRLGWDLTPAQVAALMGCSQRLAKYLVAEARAALRAHLGVLGQNHPGELAQLRDQARTTYITSVRSGTPLSTIALGARFGRSPSWAKQIIHNSGHLQRPTPAATQVIDDLAADLTTGAYPPGQRLPSTRTLATRWNTSSATVSNALRALCAQGLLTRDGNRYTTPTPPATGAAA